MNRSESIKRDRSYDSIINKLMRMRSENHESIKSAMYNFLIAAGIGAFVVVCIILRPFVRPLLWAFLMGAVLFPFKRRLAQLLNGWFERQEEFDSNMLMAICLAPIQTTEHCGHLLVDWIKVHWQILTAGVGIATCSKLLYAYAPKGFFCSIWRMIVFVHSIYSTIIGFLNIFMLIAIIVIYITSVHFFWKKENASHFAYTGQLIWMTIASYGCSFLGAFQIPAFLLIIAYISVAIIYYLRKSGENCNLFERCTKLLDKTVFTKAVNEIYIAQHQEETEDSSLSETIDSNDNDNSFQEEKLSNCYFKLLFYLCLATFLYRHVWVFILAAIPMSLHLLYSIGNYTGISTFIISKVYEFYSLIKNWAFEHHSAVLPLCLPGILEVNYKINGLVRNALKSSVDLVTSILMIILMILAVAVLGAFFAVNIYSETIEVAYLGKDLINKTITDRPELINILPANIQSSIDDVLDNAHHYGRRKIEQYIDDLLVEADPLYGQKLKDQILVVWDRVIQYSIDFNKSDTYGPRVPTEALKSTFGEIVDNPVAKQGILGWAKSNTNTILEVAKSVWHIIQTNLSVIMSFTGEILSLILSGGQACVEFILDMIVFFTALFYLLNSSGTRYAPLHVTNYMSFSSGTKVADALENSISGVLIAMFKCSVFQGLFTWWVHTIFGARIVFLPSAMVAILSAAPFLGIYWCAIPACLELWLAQDRFYVALLMFLLMFFVPPYFVEAIYGEMKVGAHPYLTGLAIAGGMYWLGWQGAIFGPLMLCFFIGIFEVASVAMKSEESKRRQSDDDTRTT